MSAGHDPADAVGLVTHYFSHLSVAAVRLTAPLAVGDRIHIHGHTTDFVQNVASLEVDHARVDRARPGDDVALKVDHAPVDRAGPGDDVALKVDDHVRDHDQIFREA